MQFALSLFVFACVCCSCSTIRVTCGCRDFGDEIVSRSQVFRVMHAVVCIPSELCERGVGLRGGRRWWEASERVWGSGIEVGSGGLSCMRHIMLILQCMIADYVLRMEYYLRIPSANACSWAPSAAVDCR